MSSPEVEHFGITDGDIEQIFDPCSRRFRQSKNKATYGIWAADSDEDEQRPAFGSRHKLGQDLTGGISFISGGFKKSTGADAKDVGVEEECVPSYNRGKKGKETMRFLRGIREKGFGDWERHTRGIGAKLLGKMGYVPGLGLGKEGQGITMPVEAVKRKGRAAVGAYGTETSDRTVQGFPGDDHGKGDNKKYTSVSQHWRKHPEDKKQKPKYVYKTAQEAIELCSKGRRSDRIAVGADVKVIDMTGREKRVLSGYHAIGKGHNMPDDGLAARPGSARAFQLPELEHNLNLLVDMTEEDILVTERRLRHNEDRVVNSKYEGERLSALCQQEEEQMGKLTSLLDIIDSCENRTQENCENRLTLDECVTIFKLLQENFYTEYKLYNLASLAFPIVFPLMKQFLSQWNVLQHPSYGAVTMQEWRLILEDEHALFNPSAVDMDPYHRLIWDVWLPPVRNVILRWNARDYKPLLEVLEVWKPALPSWILENILDQLVLPRLLAEVESWNPLVDTTPIHAWLHPWLLLMGDRLEILYAPIRYKLGNALANWHPSDVSAKIILEPWVGVFRQGHMDAFLVKHILTKLAVIVEDMPISPHQQNLDMWRWMMAWKNMLPVAPLVAMLNKSFFPRWHQVLVVWLSNMPNYDEITRWYLGWKSQISESLLQHPTIKEAMKKALDIMNQAVSGNFPPGMKENVAYFTHTERRQMESYAAYCAAQTSARAPPPKSRIGPEPSLQSAAASTTPFSFRDLVQKRAEEESLLFAPVPGKTQEGRQVYRMGRAMVYIDRNVMFLQETNMRWVPVSLQTVIDRGK